jgi:hypothetical protein
MSLEDLPVCSLELSKKIKSLGIFISSLFYWEWLNDNCYGLKYAPFAIDPTDCLPYEHFNAFIADELMDLLPAHIDTKKNMPFNNFLLEITKHKVLHIQYSINYICDTSSVTALGIDLSVKLLAHNICDKKLSDCLAKLLIYLIENNLYKKEEPINIDHLMKLID